jgi:glycogen debranching enzyme
MVARAYNALVPATLAVRTIAALGLSCALAAHGRAAEGPALPSVPRFAVEPSAIGLRGDVRPRQYVGVVGPRSAWLGVETGEAELWVHPLKLASGFRLDFRVPEYAEPIRGADVARTVEVRPEATTITYSHATFTVRQHVLAPLDEPGLLVLLEVDTVRPLEILASFRTVLQYAWPGGLGGQYAFWSPEERAFVLSESLRRRNALVGSPWAALASSHPAHALPDAPSTFTIPVDPARAAREMVPIAIVAGTAPREEIAAAYRRVLARAADLYSARRRHAEALREDGLRIDTPEDRLDLALEWAKVNLDEQRVCNPDLGCGLVAGWGPSGDGARPGFGWFFGGDAAINSLAMAATGQWEPASSGLRFLAKYQRADGKIPHEVSQAAGVVPWFQDYPYPYYHADTTPFWLLALWRQWTASADRALLDELWPAARKAWAWCLPHDTDGDGIIENTTGGLGAIEVGSIGEGIHQDVYLAAVWTRAAGAMAEMAAARGEADLSAQARALEAKARGSIESRYWIESAGHHAFGVLRSGRTNDTLTVWPATAGAFGLLEPSHAQRTLKALSTHALTSDWGARMLTTASPAYDPTHYNMGAVWPFVTGFLALGHYRYARPWAGYPLVAALGQMAFDWARGRHPELLSGAYYRPLDTAVPHQFFATSMLASSIAYGLVGWDPDAPAGRARLAPQLPPQWERARVSGLRMGQARLDVEMEQVRGRLSLSLAPGGAPFSLDVRPEWPVGARDRALFVDDARVEIGEGGGTVVALEGRVRRVEARWRGGLAILAPLVSLEPGQGDRGVRVLEFEATPLGWRVLLEGPAGGAAAVGLYGDAPASAEGASLRASGTRTEMDVSFPASTTGPFSTVEVRLRADRPAPLDPPLDPP